MRQFVIISTLILILTIGACSGTGNPSYPPVNENPIVNGNGTIFSTDMESSGHHLFGMWELAFDFDKVNAEAIPLRVASIHVNVRKFMEGYPCLTCLTLENFLPQPDNTFFIDVRFQHPFSGLAQYSGFDVRGIAIFNQTYTFPASGLTISDSKNLGLELLNADGFTTLFNPVDFPEGSDAPVFTYTKGLKATLLTSPARLNGFKEYFPDAERRLFPSGGNQAQTYHIARPVGSKIKVGYAVDASWAPPIHKPVENPLTDFGPNANCQEAYKIVATVGSGLQPGCGSAQIQIDVYDHQGIGTIGQVFCEAPDLFTGFATCPTEVDMGDYVRFTGTISNDLEADEGEYRVLVCVRDKTADPKMGGLTAYCFRTATVAYEDLDYDSGFRKHCKDLHNTNNVPNETELVPNNLGEVWTHQFPTAAFQTNYDSTPTVGEYAVYAVADSPFDQSIWALDKNSGEEKWHNNIKFDPDNAIYRSTVTVGNCEIWVGGSSIFCFDAGDGGWIWGWDQGNTHYVMGGPAIAGQYLLIWGDNDTLYCYNPYTGEYLWEYTTLPFPGNPGTPVVDNGVVYAGDAQGYAFALNLADGSEIWKVQFDKGGPLDARDIWAAPVMADGLIWYACFNCHLYGLDPADGSILKDIDLDNQAPWAAPSYDGTHLFQPLTYLYGGFTAPFRVIAIDPSDQSIDWTLLGIGDEGFFSTPVIANGVLWVVSDEGIIYMLDPDTGIEVGDGEYVLDNISTGGLSIDHGRLYVNDRAGLMYCLESK